MADELELDVEEPKKSKLILIIAIVGVVLLLGGGAAWFFLAGDGGDSAKESEKVDTSKLPLHYLTLTPEFVVNFGPGSRVRYLQVDIQVATRDETSLETLATYKPVIRNDILVLLSGLSFEVLSQETGKLDLQKKILNTINKVVVSAGNAAPAAEAKNDGNAASATGKDEVVKGPIENIYFTSFIMQ